MKTRLGVAAAAAACLSLAVVPAAPAQGPSPGPFPTEDGRGILGPNDNTAYNMGYCAPLLGGGGLGVRPWINQVLVDPGTRSPGDLYRLRAGNPDDRQCLPRR